MAYALNNWKCNKSNDVGEASEALASGVPFLGPPLRCFTRKFSCFVEKHIIHSYSEADHK